MFVLDFSETESVYQGMRERETEREREKEREREREREREKERERISDEIQKQNI